MKKLLLVTGGEGKIGTEYAMSPANSEWDVIFLPKTDLNILHPQQIENVFSVLVPDCVLNFAAYTDIEKAEHSEIENCFNVNAIGAKNLAIECKRRNIPFIHMSTSYVYDGSKDLKEEYLETDIENPNTQYGRTKYLGEKWIEESHDWYYILRCGMIYGNMFDSTYTEFLEVSQERYEIFVEKGRYFSPTTTNELFRGLETILKDLDKNKSGVYNFSCAGKSNNLEFATEIYKQSSISMNVKENKKPVSFGGKNHLLNTEKFSEMFDFTFVHWKNAMAEVISKRRILTIKVGDYINLEGETHLVVSVDWQKKEAIYLEDIKNPNSFQKISFENLCL